MMKHAPDIDSAQRAIRAFLEALGYDVDQPDVADTPARVVEAYLNDLTTGERVDISRLLEQGSFPSNSDGLIVVRDIDTMIMCPHHLLPAQGSATVAYLPKDRILGLGTVAHLVDACCRKLALQERVGDCITQALVNELGARGAYCALRFDHCCMRLRGARQSRASVETVHVEGVLREAPYAEQLMLMLARNGEVSST